VISVMFVDELIVFFFFFFQAEDGIRDLTVTGVQTCALPIFARRGRVPEAEAPDGAWVVLEPGPFVLLGLVDVGLVLVVGYGVVRSEERRVGKECRCRWAADQ